MVQDALPGGHGFAQRGQVAGLKVAAFPFLGAVEVGLKLWRDGWTAAEAGSHLLQFLPQIRPFSQQALQVFGRADLGAAGGRFGQHLAQFRRHLGRLTGHLQGLLRGQPGSLGLRQDFRRQHLFGKGSFHSHLPAAAQEGTVLLKDAAGVLIALGMGGLHQLSQQGVGFVADQFGMGLHDAAGVGPGVGLDEFLQGLNERHLLHCLSGSFFQLPIRLGVLFPQPLYFPLRLLRHLPQGRFGVVAQGGGEERARHIGQALGQPFVAPGRAHSLPQQVHQPGGLLAVLFRAGALGRGEDETPTPALPLRGGGGVDQQRHVHLPLVATVRAGQVVEGAVADALRQVGALIGVYDEPEVGFKALPTAGTGEGGCLGKRKVGHRDAPFASVC